MTPSHIEHIGIAVTNLDEAIRYWEDVMGLKCYAIEEVKDQKVKPTGTGSASLRRFRAKDIPAWGSKPPSSRQGYRPSESRGRIQSSRQNRFAPT